MSDTGIHLTGLDPRWGLVLGLLLVLLNGFFVAAEFALAKVRPTQIDPYVKRGQRKARIVAHMLEHLDAYLSATQLGITLASIALGWVGEPAFAWLLEPLFGLFGGVPETLRHSLSLTLSFATVSVLHIVFGELVPKSLAIGRPAAISLWTALPLYGFYWVAFPAIWILNHAASGILRLAGLPPVSEHEGGHSEEELRLLLVSHGAPDLSAEKQALLRNVFELFDRVARQVMVPRADVVFLSTTRSIDENLATARESGHTRFPLCEGELDRILGIVHIKDLFRADRGALELATLARPIQFVPETTGLDKLLGRMRNDRQHMAAVVDEYGGVSGIVTLENVIEELVGPIQDEFDAEKPEIVAESASTYRVSGAMLVVDLEGALGLEISDRDEDTIGGLVFSAIGRRPRVGDEVALPGITAQVLEVQGSRIRALEVRRTVTAEESAAE